MKHLIVGLILLCLGAWGIIAWWLEFGAALRGLAPLLLVLVGLAAIGTGVRSYRGVVADEEDETPGLNTSAYVRPDGERLAS